MSTQPPTKKPRAFQYYLSNSDSGTIEAPSLRAALRKSGLRETAHVSIVAVIDTACLARSGDGDQQPFTAILLRNPSFVIPE